MYTAAKGTVRFYAIIMSRCPSSPVCVKVFKGSDYIKALQETTKMTALESSKNPYNFPEFDTVSIDIPENFLKEKETT
jgi:hypothetical protein